MDIRANFLWAGFYALLVLLDSVVDEEGEDFGCGGFV